MAQKVKMVHVLNSHKISARMVKIEPVLHVKVENKDDTMKLTSWTKMEDYSRQNSINAVKNQPIYDNKLFIRF